MSHLRGRGDTCSADGMRFYVPVDVLAANYSHLLQGRGVTPYAHTGENAMRVHQEPIPVRLREATFVLDGLLEHETEFDPRTVYTDTHGYTEVVMATAALLGKSLAPRIARMHEQTLYKLDPSRHYAHLDPILNGTVKPHLVRRAWDETVRIVDSIHARTASPSLILHRLGSYARQQALNEIGRMERTVHILRTIDEEERRPQQSRELNKGESSHDLSRFLFFWQGRRMGRGFDDQFRSFSCLSVLHNAVVAWNIKRIGRLVEQLRTEGHAIDDAALPQTTPLIRKHLNPFGQAVDIMRWWRDFVRNSPETLGGWFAFLKVPPGPPFPTEFHTRTMAAIVWTYSGPVEEGEAVFARIRREHPPAIDFVGPLPFPVLQSMFDGLVPHGIQSYWRADFLNEISDEAIARHIEHASRLPTLQSTMHIYPVNGAAHRVGPHDTASGVSSTQ